MSITDAAVQSLLENISRTMKQRKTGDLWEGLEKLQTEATKLRVAIRNPNFNFGSDSDSGIYLEFRGVLVEAEDAVDSAYLRIKDSSDQVCRSWLRWMRPSMKALAKTRAAIERAACRVEELNTELLFLCYEDEHLSHRDRPHSVLNVEKERVIGFDEAVKELADLLTKGPDWQEVISVVGKIGQGKTALARKVYKDCGVDYEYYMKAFVYDSSRYDKRQLLLKILASFKRFDEDKFNWNRMDGDHLEDYVYKKLEGKQYLVVLDDVRAPEDWYRIRDAFPDNENRRSRVLMTTRDEAVAKAANRDPHSLYNLRFMHQEFSRELFRRKVFGENDCPVSFKEYEEDIVRKCDGYPLALVTVASMITRHSHEVDWWKAVACSMKNYIARDAKHATFLVNLAYKHLPDHLKPCFLYLAAFPENYEIPVWKLLRLWIAEGFIQQRSRGSQLNLEELAEQYLEVLADRNLVIVTRMRSNGKVAKCVMNGILYQFCKREAAENNFFVDMDRYNQHLNIQYPSGCHRLCLNNVNVFDYLSRQPSGKNAASHSFLNYFGEETKVTPEMVSCITKSFGILKILEVQSLSFTVFPDSFCSLVFLKYLAISGGVKTLPSTLSDLWNLQTLVIDTTSSTLKIEVDVWKMPNFRHLRTNASASFPCRVSPEIQKSENDEYVQSLCYVSPESLKKGSFDRTTKLKKLGIRGRLSELFEANGTEFRLLPYFQKLEWLENLKLLNEDTEINIFSGLLPKGNFPKKLSKLTLSNTRIDWEEMHTLGELENLEVLKLKEYAFVGKKWKAVKGGFLRLKHLHIGRTDLMLWETSSDHFPQLMSLEISECDQLWRIPRHLADILSLQVVRLFGSTSPGVGYSLKRLRLVKFLQAKGDKRRIFEISISPPPEE